MLITFVKYNILVTLNNEITCIFGFPETLINSLLLFVFLGYQSNENKTSLSYTLCIFLSLNFFSYFLNLVNIYLGLVHIACHTLRIGFA